MKEQVKSCQSLGVILQLSLRQNCSLKSLGIRHVKRPRNCIPFITIIFFH